MGQRVAPGRRDVQDIRAIGRTLAGRVHGQGMSEPASAARSSAPARFHLLDGLRGLAAFAVILDHVPSATLAALTPGRYLAVDFFFVLSGYVLAHAYGRALADGLSPLAFMRMRFARLYPLYLLGLLLALAVLLAQRLAGWTDLPWTEIAVVAGAGFLFLPMPPAFGWTTGHLYPLNGPAWSLFFELVANLAYALVARFLTPAVLAVLLPVAGIATLVGVINHDTPGPGWLWPHFGAGLSRVAFGFFAGVCLYRFRERLAAPAVVWWIPVLIFAGMVMVPAPDGWRNVFDAAAAIAVAPLVVWLGANAKIPAIYEAFCDRLGRLSFGVYILHVPVMAALGLAMALAGWLPPFGFAHVLLVAGLAAAGAALADRFWDKPLRRLLSRGWRAGSGRLAPNVRG